MFRAALVPNTFFRSPLNLRAHAPRTAYPVYPRLNRYPIARYSFEKKDNFTAKSLNWLGLIGAGVFVVGVIDLIYRSNVKQPQICDEALSDPNSSQWLIRNEKDFERAGVGSTVGRSHGYKLKWTDPETGELEFYYCKEPFDRTLLQNELIAGTFGNMLYPDEFPKVYALQCTLENEPGKAEYKFISESKGHQEVYHSNLEEWANEYYQDEEAIRNRPHNLGIPIAFDEFMGKTDSKFANYVTPHSRKYPSYPIDNESAFREPAQFFDSSRGVVNHILEYQEDKFQDTLMRTMVEGLDVKQDNPHLPLLSKPVVLSHAKPVLEKAIQEDFDDHLIQDFYLKVVNISDEQLKSIPAKFGPLFTPAEREHYFNELKTRREDAKKFIAEHPDFFSEAPRSGVQPKC